MTAADIASSFADLPGAGLVAQGLADVAAGRETVAGELVKIGSPRLRECGVDVPVEEADALEADRRLYRLLGAAHGNAAHSQYNALIRQLVSFERALEQRRSRARRTATKEGVDADPEADGAWEVAICDRIRAIDEGRVVGVPFEDVMREAERRLSP